MSEKQIYFAAANTGSGFVSYFSEIFDPDEMKKLYIIKGGPGTGKSTLAGKLADAAEERGHTVTRYLCSSDPSSLDGIMIEDLRVGVIDGTAPHAADPKYPGSVDTTVDLYRFFDDGYLEKNRETVTALVKNAAKKHASSRVYRGYAATAAAEALSLVSSCTDAAKLRGAVGRAVSALRPRRGKALHRQISAFSSGGAVSTDTYRRLCTKRIGVCDEHGSAYFFMNMLKQRLESNGAGFFYSTDTLIPENCEAIYVPEDGTCFEITGRLSDTDGNGYERLINMKRFVDAEKLRGVRQRLRMCEKVRSGLDAEAEKLIREAGKIHSELEAVYKNAVDFDGVSELTKKLTDIIL